MLYFVGFKPQDLLIKSGYRCGIGHCCLNGIGKPFLQTDFQWQLCRIICSDTLECFPLPVKENPK